MLRPFCLSLLALCFWLSSVPKPEPRHGGKTLCLFADGHTELLDTDNMTSEERRKYFQRDEN